jgi:hypothetical protein
MDENWNPKFLDEFKDFNVPFDVVIFVRKPWEIESVTFDLKRHPPKKSNLT